MTDQNLGAAARQEMPPEGKVMQLIMGGFVSQAVYVAAKLGIADLLAVGEKTTADLAAASGADERSLYRLLRTLASLGVFTETSDRTFANTSMSDTMLADSPTSLRAMLLMIGDPEHGRVINDMEYSVRTGKPAWEHVHGDPVFKYCFETNKNFGDLFNHAMTSLSHSEIAAVLSVYDFSGINTMADIAGGYGHLLGAILQKHPSMNGVLFDLETVLEGAPAMLESYGVSDRVRLVEGDFFTDIPVAADAYIMKHIIHDWYDDNCEKIFGCIRRSMPDDARVLIVDAVIPPGNDPHPGKLLDLEMLISPGGVERTAAEFETLLTNSGFRLNRIIPTPSPVSIVEALKA
ncbi:MAG: methyltransferase [Pyrinomonadaceae bacterium]